MKLYLTIVTVVALLFAIGTANILTSLSNKIEAATKVGEPWK